MDEKATISRRSFVRSAVVAGLGTVSMPNIISASAQSNRIICRDAGIGTTFQDCWAGPFKKATGIEVVGVVSQAEPVGLIKQMVETSTYTWDMASGLSDSAAFQLSSDGNYLAPLNIEGDANWAKISDSFKTDRFVATNVIASVMAYSTKAKTPSSWADYFNVAGFPGLRGLRRFPFDTIEFALLADGVPIDQLYPCDLDRAFKALDRIKKNISVWWTSGAQTAQLLQAGEVEYINSWNGRVQPLIDQGRPLKILWNQALWGGSGFVLLRGGPKAELCREFIKFCMKPEQQGAYANATGYGFTIPDALKFVSPEMAPKLPTHPDNAKSVAAIDFRYWTKNREKAVDRFNQWVLG